MSEPQERSRQFVECPVCGRLAAVPPDLVSKVEFPGDIAVIADICYGRFNSVPHHCGNRFFVSTAVVGVRRATKQMVLVGEPAEDTLRSLAKTGWSVSVVDDYNGLAYQVIKWIEQDSAAFWPGLRDNSLWRLSPREALDRVSPIQLLSVKLARDRRLRVLVARRDDPTMSPVATSDERVLDAVDRMGVLLTIEQLKRVVRIAIFDGNGGRLEEVVAARVPVDCLDDGVLDGLAGEVESSSPARSPDDAMRKHVLLVTCAVAHRLAGRSNPAAGRLAALLAELHELGELDNVELDERVWLTPQQLRRLVDAESVFDAARTLAMDDEFGLFSPRSFAFLERVGWSDLILGMTPRYTARTGAPGTDIDAASFAKIFLEVAREQATDADQWKFGELIAGGFFRTIQGGMPIDEYELLNNFVRGLTQQATPVALLAFYTGVIYHANLAGRRDLASLAASEALKRVFTAKVGPLQIVDVLVEVGNTFRYESRWDAALAVYDNADRISRLLPDGLEQREAILARNRALVLRDAGRFREAEALLLDHARAHPDDVDAQESLMILYERTGRRNEALVLVDQQLARTDLSPHDSGRFLHLRGALRTGLGQHDAAAADCMAALRIHGNDLARRLQIEACALRSDPVDGQLAAFVANCERHAIEILDGPYLDHPDEAITAATMAALRQLRGGRITAAGELIEKISNRFHLQARAGPWQFEFAVGWHALETGGPRAFDHLRTAIEELETRLPMALEADYAVGALSEFAIEDVQRLACRAGVAAIATRRNEPADLISVLDIANGRDLTARASGSAQITDPGPEMVKTLDDWQRGTRADIVAFVDDTPTLQLLVQPAQGSRRLVDTAIPTTDLAAAVRELRWFDFTNPVAPHITDARLTSWWELAAEVATVIRRELPGDRELVMVPGRVLLATPLHAAGWPDRPLIADRPISSTPNHRLLVGRRTVTPVDAAPYGLIAVPKAADSPAFVARLDSFVEEFRSKAPQARAISASDADEEASLAVLEGSEVALVLCHGVHGGRHLGPGICVAAAGLLPPAQLDLGANPDLADFVLTWDDIAYLPHSPDLLVSIACSSGRTVVGSGGSRLGLEQGSVANETRFVVAPLWPVEQHTSLSWVEAFLKPMDLAGKAALENVPHIHQAATLALAEQYPHPYHWAPYALTTALRGGLSCPTFTPVSTGSTG